MAPNRVLAPEDPLGRIWGLEEIERKIGILSGAVGVG
jgi:hypothetical protein